MRWPGRDCDPAGVSGAGKTSLANAIRIPASESNCLVLEGKFNQFDLDVPYVALRQVLQQLCTTILRANDAEKIAWVKQIREAVQDHGALLIHLVPEFSPLLGNQPPLEAIGPLEARHRFASLIQSVLKVVCRPESPLVLFIDDCQWADPASLQLLSSLAIGTDLKYLFLIAAYREEETDANHPFLALVRDWERQSLAIRQCKLDSLSIDGIHRMLRERVIPSDCTAEAIGQAILTRSGGMPFLQRSLFIWYLSLENHSILSLKLATKRKKPPPHYPLISSKFSLSRFSELGQSSSPSCRPLLA